VLARMEKDETRALLDEADSTAEESRRQYERTRQLSAQGAASTAQLDEARRVSETARARQLAIESRLNDRVITAPFDGVVGLRNISAGALVRPGDLIATIDDDSVMKLDFPVPAVLIGSIATGARIEARTAAFAGRVFTGEVGSIDSRIDPVTRSVIVRAVIPNEDRLLRPGLLMTVELLANTRDALLIPEEAVLPLGRRTSVVVVEDSPQGPVGRRADVVLGMREGGMVEVVSGLEAGMRVVTHGAPKVTDGAVLAITTAPEPVAGPSLPPRD
jgi:membrane fusion protein (multidrug efflux system)